MFVDRNLWTYMFVDRSLWTYMFVDKFDVDELSMDICIMHGKIMNKKNFIISVG